MSNFISRHRNKLLRHGYDVGNVYKNNTEYFVSENFSSSPTFKNALLSSRKYPNKTNIHIRSIGVERLGSLREVLFLPDESVELGAYLNFDEADWIVFDEYGTGISPKVMVAKCNRVLKWLDKNGVSHNQLCVASSTDLGSKSKQGKSEIEWNKYDIKLPRNQLFIFTPLNDNTKEIKLNTRFIIGSRVYEVVGVDDTTSVSIDGFGIIQLTIRLTTTRENDDFDNGVAENLYGKDDENNFIENDMNDGGDRLW